MSTAELNVWLHHHDPQKFPYDAVVREFHAVGKHFVSAELLATLAKVRRVLPRLNGPWPSMQTLADFLDSALDKLDGRYDYPSYLALPLLHLPTVDDPLAQAPFARSRCDRLTTQLVADALAFELAVAEGHTHLLPDMRPDRSTVAKRCRLGVRSVRPALSRLALAAGVGATDSIEEAHQVIAVVRADMSVAERQAMQLSILPVYTAHDEYLFLRVLQLFETVFALLVVQLRVVLAAMDSGEADRARYFLHTAESALRESAPLFSMLATMQVDSFRTFRSFTEGASAIQSRNYKLVESLCRQPDSERVDSPAFQSVPDVRDRVLVGQRTLDEAYQRACVTGILGQDEQERLGAGMRAFAGALMRWRQTHYRLAVRMLGDSTGTGYTAGTPYLASVQSIPVFLTVNISQDGDLDRDTGQAVTAR